MPKRQSYSRETRLKVQRLYLGKSMDSGEIAAELGLPLQQVYNIVHRYGLAEIRAKNEKRALARVEDKAVAEAEEFVASITPQAMEAAEHGFKLARTEDAKEFAMAMKGTQIAVQLARQGLGLDARGSTEGGRGNSLHVFYAEFREAGAAAEKRAEPVDVRADDVSDSVILDFEQSQQGSDPAAESAELIGNRAQVVDKAI